MLTLYHTTKKELLPGIMKDGLKPAVRDNAMLCDEDENVVWLCPEGSIPIWYILLKNDTVIRINGMPDDEVTGHRAYTGYDEYWTDKEIPASRLSLVNLPTRQELHEAMQYLTKGYMHIMSYDCIALIRADESWDGPDRVAKIAEYTLKNLEIIKRLDFSVNSQETYRKEILRISNDECGFTFSDYYYPGCDPGKYPDAGRRCFERIANLPGKLGDAGRQYSAFIRKTFSDAVLYPTDIGGYCR